MTDQITTTIERAGSRWAFTVAYNGRAVHRGKAASKVRAERAAAKTAAQLAPGYYNLGGGK